MKSLGLLSIIFYTLALVYMHKKWPSDKTKTFSRNIARAKTSIIYYAVMFVIFLTILSFFMWSWFFPSFQVSVEARYFFTLATLGQLVAVFVPETGRYKKVIHLIGASVMTLCVLFFTILLALNQYIGLGPRLVAIFASIFMFLCWLLVIFYKKITQHSLLVQSLYFLVFFITILAITYFS